MIEKYLTISVIIPVHNNEATLDFYISNFPEVHFIGNSEVKIILVFIDDGSTDNSYIKLKNISSKRKYTNVIRLSRNFGQHSAIKCGLDHSESDYYILMDADLDNSIDQAIELISYLISNELDIVIGVISNKRKNIFSKMYHFITNKIDSGEIPKGFSPITLRGFSHKVKSRIELYKEVDLNYGAIFSIIGYQIAYYRFDNLNNSTKTSYTMKKKIDIFFNYLAFYSDRFAIFFMKMLTPVTILTITYVLIVLFQKFVFGIQLASDLTIILLSIFCLFLLFSLSMLVITYLITILLKQTKNRPPYILKE